MDSKKIECYGRMVDLISYQLGKISTCSEIVGAGVKEIALSSPLEPEEMEQLIDTAKEIVKNFKVSAYLEKDLLTTDLFDEDFTRGKHVLLVYKNPEVKERYLALKDKKATLISQDRYRGEERTNIAREMGRLLSYTEEHIDEMLSNRPSALK